MSMQLTQSMEVSILNILSIHTWTWLLLFSFTHFCSNLQFFPPPHIGKSALFSILVILCILTISDGLCSTVGLDGFKILVERYNGFLNYI